MDKASVMWKQDDWEHKLLKRLFENKRLKVTMKPQGCP